MLRPLADIARECEARGCQALAEDDEEALCNLFRKEVRKGAFKPFVHPPGEVLAAFCKHVRSEFSPANTQYVVDFLPYFRARAKGLSSEELPLAALVLYATWIEHWLNMMITVAMLRRGDEETVIGTFFARQPTLEHKVASLSPVLGLPQLESRLKSRLIQVTKTRNRFVHYTWIGKASSRLKKEHAGLRALITKAEGLLDDLVAYEDAALDRQFDSIVSEMFPRSSALLTNHPRSTSD